VRIPEVEIFFSSTGDTEIILIIHLAPYSTEAAQITYKELEVKRKKKYAFGEEHEMVSFIKPG
jgi:accessory gene regulator protein AgrB